MDHVYWAYFIGMVPLDAPTVNGIKMVHDLVFVQELS